MDRRSYNAALKTAMREGLKEQREKNAVKVKRSTKKSEKKKLRQKKKKEMIKLKQQEKEDSLEEDKRLHVKDEVKFGEVIDCPPDIEIWTEKLDQIKQKMQRQRRFNLV